MSVLTDSELVELLHDRADLLAVADAVSATQRRRRRVPRPVLAVPVAVAAAVALLLVAPWESRGPSVVDRALAAVGGGPVVHAVVEYSWPQDVTVNLATGGERMRVHRAEYWYDEQRRVLLSRSATDGGEPVDYLVRGGLPERLDPALAGFATRYRDALASGDARIVGDATVEGRPAKQIELPPRGSGSIDEVLVDAHTYVPLSFRSTYPGGRRSPEWRVITIEAVPRDPALFVPKNSPLQPATGEVTEGHAVSTTEAERVLGAPLLGLDGRAPDSVELSHTTAWLTDGSKVSGVLVRLAYPGVRLSFARDVAGSYAIGFGEGEFPTPPEGSVAVTGSDSEGWQGELRYSGFAVMLSAPSKAEVLAAARALRQG